jgi:hypothetical protein
MSILK